MSATSGMSERSVQGQKLGIAEKVTSRLQPVLKDNLRAVGVCGSVGRGTAQKYSDVDLLILVRENPRDLARIGIRQAHNGNRFIILDDTYCSLGFETWNSAVSQLTKPSYDLPELLGGFTKIRQLYDPDHLLPKLEARAQKIPSSIFQQSAELALLHSYEDFCRVKNAFLAKDEIVMRDNANYVTHSAALVVACLNQAHFRSDREIFKAHKRMARTPRGFASQIQKIRYGGLTDRKLLDTLFSFYLNLIVFTENQGIGFPVSRDKLVEL